MKASSRLVNTCALFALAVISGVLWPRFATGQAGMPVSVQRIAVIGSKQGVGVQINTSAPVITEAQMLAGPDRLVIDFPGALPGRELRSLRLNQGDIKSVRAGLFRSNPPITRVVVELNAPTAYDLVSSGNAVIVTLGSETAFASLQPLPGITIERHPTARALTALAHPADPPLRVGFDRGLLTISATKATLADVLYQVHLKTGADIPIPSGAEQEQVVIQAGPGPAKDVLVTLLNGSRFNYVLEGTPQDPTAVGAVILTPKANVGMEPSAPTPQPMGVSEGGLAPPTTPPAPPMQPDPNVPPQVDPE